MAPGSGPSAERAPAGLSLKERTWKGGVCEEKGVSARAWQGVCGEQRVSARKRGVYKGIGGCLWRAEGVCGEQRVSSRKRRFLQGKGGV